jgi:toxin ParE1/3/4
MTSYVLSRRAEDDLTSVFVAGFALFGARQAELYAREMEATFALLAAHPQMGRDASRIAPQVRRHEHGAHVILYEAIPDGVRILAVVHRASVRHLSL